MSGKTRIYKFQWMPLPWLMLVVMAADELWSNTLMNGDRKYNLFAFGWYERPDSPGIRLYSIIILWLSIRIGINSTYWRKPR